MKVLRAAGIAAALALGAPAMAHAGAPAPIDPQNWTFQDNATWNDYKPLPGPDYSDASIQPSVKKWKVALVVTDFPDKTFYVSQPVGSTIYGTPTTEAHDIPRADVPAFYRDFLNKPQALNHFQTMNRYWMEDSYGKYGVSARRLRPLPAAGQLVPVLPDRPVGRRRTARRTARSSPRPSRATLDFRTDARAAWLADVGADRRLELRQHLLRLRRRGRVLHLAGVRDDEVQDPGRRHRPVRPEGLRRPDADQLGRLAATCRGRAGSPWPTSGPTPAATRRSRARARAWAPTPTSSRTTSTSPTTTTTRSPSPTSGPARACGT